MDWIGDFWALRTGSLGFLGSCCAPFGHFWARIMGLRFLGSCYGLGILGLMLGSNKTQRQSARPLGFSSALSPGWASCASRPAPAPLRQAGWPAFPRTFLEVPLFVAGFEGTPREKPPLLFFLGGSAKKGDTQMAFQMFLLLLFLTNPATA